jgi:hypothetical protein
MYSYTNNRILGPNSLSYGVLWVHGFRSFAFNYDRTSFLKGPNVICSVTKLLVMRHLTCCNSQPSDSTTRDFYTPTGACIGLERVQNSLSVQTVFG